MGSRGLGLSRGFGLGVQNGSGFRVFWARGLLRLMWRVQGFESIWEFPKIGDPNFVPQIVGSLL